MCITSALRNKLHGNFSTWPNSLNICYCWVVNLYLVMLFNFRPLKGKAFLLYMPVLFFKGSSRGVSIHAIEIALS